MDKKIGFIGCGNMGSAMLAGIINSNLLEKENIYCSVKTNESKDRLKKKFGINLGSNEEIAKECDILILAVKPHFFSEVIAQIKSIVKKDSIIISIAAGVEIKDIEDLFDIKELKVVRAMPNTPALVGEGMTALCPNNYLGSDEIKEVEDIFNSFGKSEILEEKYFHAFIAICGSSPAYGYMFIEAMGTAGIKAGLQSTKAYRLAAQSLLGTAKMVLETGEHPASLRDRVCSPGGTTIEAVTELENTGFRTSVIKAMEICEKNLKKFQENN